MFAKLKSFLLQNTTAEQTVAKNAVWLFLGQLFSRLFRAAIVIYGARTLGAESWGAFSYALGVATFLTIFSDIGINTLISREGSRSPELRSQYLATAFFTKLGLLTLLFAAVTLFFPYLSRIPEATLIMPILIFVFVFDTLRDLGSALARALERMEIEAGVQVFTNFAIVALGFIFLYREPVSRSLAFAYALGSGLGLMLILFTLRAYFKEIFKNFKSRLMIPILRDAWPFGLLSLTGILMLNTDIIMLGWLRSAQEVGYYSVAQKLIQLLYVFPTLVAVSFLPSLAKMTHAAPEAAKRNLEKIVTLVLLFALPIVLGGIILANPLIKLFFGAEYLPAVLTFQMLMLTVLVVYPASILGHAIFAYNQQNQFIAFTATAVIGNVIFNFLLIPTFGIEGAAASTILTQLAANYLIWRKMKKLNNLAIWPQVKKYLRLT